jgi:predicted ATPase/class 3 adenylate cyclase
MAGASAFLATDIEGSTWLWEQSPEKMAVAHAKHDLVLAESIAAHGGDRFLIAGDAVQAVFESVDHAIAGAIEAQRALARVDWPLPDPIRVRMAIHVAAARPDGDGVFRSPELIHLDALLLCGHGGQILVSRAAAEETGLGPLLVDLGTYHLPGMRRAESVYQVQVEGLPGHFPALRAHRSATTNLPIPATRLIGRSRELSELHGLIYGKQARLVTLTGSGGIGKTRLAQQLALDLRDEQDETVWFVDLISTTDPSHVTATIASALQLPELGFGSPLEAVAASLRGSRTIVVLDNFEHFLPAADTVAHLLALLPDLRIIVTSRGPLRVRGEWQFPIDSLSLPSSLLGTWDELNACESVQLFVDRVATIAPEAKLDDRHVSAVAGICQKLEGVPLAIELAAPRMRVLSVDELNERLEDRLAMQANSEPSASGRHRAMRASISWSYDLLPPERQCFFRQLGVLQSGCTFDTVDGLLGDQFDSLDQVAALVEQSLVRPGGFHAEGERFTLLESVRQFALELLDQHAELDEARERHARYFTSLVLDRYSDPRDYDAAAVQHMRSEMDELSVAIEWMAMHDPARALEVGAGAWRLWFVVGRLADADRWLELVLDVTTGLQTVERVRAIYGRALIAHARNLLDRSIAFDIAGLALAEQLGDQRGIGDACNHLAGMISISVQDHDRALGLVERAIEAYHAIDDQHGIAESLYNRAAIAYELGRIADALEDGQQMLAYCRAEGKDVLASNALNGVAEFAMLAGQHELARNLLREGLELSRRLGYDVFLSANLSVMNALLLASGWYEDALRLAEFARLFTLDVAPGGDLSDPFGRVEAERSAILANLSPEVVERAIEAAARMTPAEAVEQGLALLDRLPA